MNMIELLGYVAMVLVALSFLMKDIIKLRLINAIGCACFVVYALLLPTPAYPVAGLNILVVCVNIYYILKAKKSS